MQFSVAAALALLTAAASAAPAADVVARAVSSVPITLTGVNPADTVTIYVGDNDQGFPITNPLAVAHIAASTAPGTTCSFDGVEGFHGNTAGAQTIDVAPPQRLVFATCVSNCQRTGNGC